MSLNTTEFAVAGQARAGNRLVDLLLRVGLALALLYGAYRVTLQAIAEWHFRRESPAEIGRAIARDPSNAKYYVAHARALAMSPDGADRNEVIGLYATATRLSPGRAQYWADLGGSYEWAGREEEAGRAYERARQLFPRSPDINWQLGNFHFRAGRTLEALRAFRNTLQGDPKMRRPAFDLAWRAGADSRAILAEMIPDDVETLFDYLNYLNESQRLDEAGQVWIRLLEREVHFDPRRAFAYLDGLIQHHRVNELRAAWAALARRHAVPLPARRFDANLITNGDFEDEILNGGLDWRVAPVEGVVVRVVSSNHFDGTRALEIRFEGKRNIEYVHVLQYVPVRPNSVYRFVADARAQDVTTDSGPRLQIFDASDPSRFSVATENMVGSSNWSPQQLQFKTGPQTQLLVVRVARPLSRRFANRISGTVWIDRVSLTAVEEPRSGPAGESNKEVQSSGR